MIDHERRAVRILAGICRRIIRDKPELIEQLRSEKGANDAQSTSFARKQSTAASGIRTPAPIENR